MAPTIPWDELIRRFDPWSPLSSDEIPTLYVARPSPPLAQLDQFLLPRHRSSRVLLAGQRSSGKTTELHSLMPRFGQDYLVIMVDVSEPLKRPDTTMMDLLYNLGRMIFLAGETGFPRQMDRQLFEKRLPEGLDIRQIIEPSLIDRLARSGGGVVRDSITLVQLACHVAQRGQIRGLADDAVQAAEEWLQQNYRAKLNTRVIEILRDVQRTKIQPESPLVPELVFETLMVAYSHRGHVWWETHPALGRL